ncbi:hypothetical protein PPYR_07185 [Photinus pyralis]|uniref:Sphingomyelin phosphodiesterase n=1 Tax=Photinus pyralis TaxID=7054 RepID=A0A5N4APM3_PHOPY|nr:hypothetical protein PPYR_07185 [Photinus pyralis]
MISVSSAMSNVLLFLLIVGGCFTEKPSDKWRSQLRRDLEGYINSPPEKQQSEVSLISSLTLPQVVQRWLTSPLNGEPLCDVCDVMVEIAINARKLEASEDLVAEVFVKMCLWLGLERASFCETYVKNNIDIWLYIIDNKPSIRSRTFCVYALHKHHCRDPERMDWTIELPPRLTSDNADRSPTNTKQSPLKILHLTDVHYDPGYEVGSNAKCDEILCCQKGTKANRSSDQAGYWGSYPCDSPWHTVENVLTEAIERHKTFDAIYFTGDIIKHSEWLTGVKNNIDDILKVFDKFEEVFKGLPVFPTLGNHEPHPAHQFSSDGIDAKSNLSTQWVYDLVGKSWDTWLPEESLQTVFKGGYYALIKPGLRLIALNNNVCFTYNNWLFYDDNDPLGQLKWMVKVLAEAEKKGEKVHIISHIPSNDLFCFFNWGKEYTRIVERYNLVLGQFNGHTHDDDFIVYFSSQNTSKAINVAYVGGSATTFRNLNSNYKIFHVDANTYATLNYESWIYNLTEANLTPNNPPRWYKLYDFKTSFNLSSLNPSDFADLIEHMTQDSGLLQDYHRYKKREADPEMAVGCNRKCQLDDICYMTTSWYGGDYHCHHYTAMYNDHQLKH